MDSLLTNYASSDDDEEEAKPSSSSSSSSPPPKPTSPSCSFFSSLPPPKFHHHHQEQPPPSKPQSSLFSKLPAPKSQPSSSSSKGLTPNPKRLVQFILPLDPSLLKSNHPDDDDDDDIVRKQPIKEDSSSSSLPKGLNSMLPAPKNSLCLAPKKTHVPNSKRVETKQERTDLDQERSKIEDHGGSHGDRDWAARSETHLLNTGTVEEEGQERTNFGGYGSQYNANWVAQSETQNQGSSQFGDHGVYPVEVYGNYGDISYESGCGGYVGSWNDGSTAAAAAPDVPELGRIAGKRGRNEFPADIVEVKQDELMKNRPRADQAKLTGIAFGPAYQPVSTSKGKPSKLHKRKHQIGSLFFDMKQKEMELAERSAKGFLTKAETQAKYDW